MTHCKGFAFVVASWSEYLSQARSQVIQHYRASGLQKRRMLTIAFYSIKMETSEYLRNFLLRVYRLVKELERVGWPVDPKDVNVLIPSGVIGYYDAEV